LTIDGVSQGVVAKYLAKLDELRTAREAGDDSDETDVRLHEDLEGLWTSMTPAEQRAVKGTGARSWPGWTP
jgi:hypothetical protein